MKNNPSPMPRSSPPSLSRPGLTAVFFSLLGAALMLAAPASASNAPLLEEQFRNPPIEARPTCFWPWMNGHITKEGIRADLEAMKSSGMRGGIIFDLNQYIPDGDVAHGSPQWHALVDDAIATGHEMGLEIGFQNCPGWATSGGPWVTPEDSMKRVVFSEVTVDATSSDPILLPAPEVREDFYRDIAVLAVPEAAETEAARIPDSFLLTLTGRYEGYRQGNPYNFVRPPHFIPREAHSMDPAGAVPPGAVLDLTGFLQPDGRLVWTPPPGKWTILRFGFTSTGAKNHPARKEAQGLEVDKMDADAVRRFFASAVAPVLERAKGRLPVIFMDSWEAGLSNWTGGFEKEFRARRGYDIRPFLPVLAGRVVGSPAESHAFLHDFRVAITDLVAENYHRVMRAESARHGAQLALEPYQDVMMDSFKSGLEADRIMAEFWSSGLYMDWVRRTSSMVETMREDKWMSAEAFTARPENAGWRMTPRTLKSAADTALVQGVNDFTLHSLPHQPRDDMRPGFTHGRYGVEFGRHVTWWPMAGAFHDYLARCGLLLRQGNRVADFLCMKNEGPSISRSDRHPEMPAGYDHLFIAPFILQQSKVENGRVLTPGGGSHRALVLPFFWLADLPLLDKLIELKEGGVPVLGGPPVMPAGRNALRQIGEWRQRVERLFPPDSGSASTASLREALASGGIGPDFSFDPQDAPLEFAHRRTTDLDIYFIRNAGTDPVKTAASFRVSADRAQLWDPLDGSVRTAKVTALESGMRSVPIELPPMGSIFVVFGAGDGLVPPEPARELMAEVAPAGWKVTFLPPGGEPFEREFTALGLWNESDDEAVRYFSGTAVYESTFDLPSPASDARVFIDLGKVHDMARVRINGLEAGISWTPPDRLDITALVQAGTNRLEIEVANTWINRLIGDEALPVEAVFEGISSERGSYAGVLRQFPDWYRDPAKTASRQRPTFAMWKHYEKNSPLVPAGLAGPVILRVYSNSPLN